MNRSRIAFLSIAAFTFAIILACDSGVGEHRDQNQGLEGESDQCPYRDHEQTQIAVFHPVEQVVGIGQSVPLGEFFGHIAGENEPGCRNDTDGQRENTGGMPCVRGDDCQSDGQICIAIEHGVQPRAPRRRDPLQSCDLAVTAVDDRLSLYQQATEGGD